MTKQSNTPIVIPSSYFSRLEIISDKLGINSQEAIQALLTWTEMGLSLADSLDLNELTPQDTFESVEHLKSDAQSSSSASNVYSDSGNVFDKQSIQKLYASAQLMAETVSIQQQSTGRTVASSDNSHNKSVDTPKEPSTPKETYKMVDQTADAERSINQGIDLIMEHNEKEDVSRADKWYIGLGCVRKLTGRGDAGIRRVLKARKEEIDAHHSLHELGRWHNARGYNYPDIKTVISLPDDEDDEEED